jgi:hypothetical protein
MKVHAEKERKNNLWLGASLAQRKKEKEKEKK